ncbi:DUF4174 domain-containing protein [Mariniflexile sp.]|uniref:DUF4174 domain-containing protein n=1 Tax=Mariniflexile sp. TaxID=1979402 RepID=UPI00356275F5
MCYLKTLLFFLFFFNINTIIAQDMDAHKWKNRVLLVLSDDDNNLIFKNQINEFKAHEKELKDRKLIVYQISKEGYAIGLNQVSNWQKTTKTYKIYKKDKKSSFEIILIGLDGGEKLRQSDFITSEALFRVIDVMPMRRSELKNK